MIAKLRQFFSRSGAVVSRLSAIAPAKESLPEILSIAEAYKTTMQDLDQRQRRWLGGISTGLEVDEFLGGLRAGDVTLLAARFGIGKSAFAQRVAWNVGWAQGIPTALLSLNTSLMMVGRRLLSAQANIPLHRLRKMTLSEEERSQLVEYVHASKDAPLLILNSPGAGIEDIRIAAKKLRTLNRTQLLIVDDLEALFQNERTEDQSFELV